MDGNEPGADPRLLVEAMARKDGNDLEGFLELFAPDCEIVFPGAVLHGIEEWRRFVAAYFEAFPDGHYELARLEPVGQTVFAEGVWSAVHTGILRTPAERGPADRPPGRGPLRPGGRGPRRPPGLGPQLPRPARLHDPARPGPGGRLDSR